MQATKLRDHSHARLYSTWAELPTWHALSPNARALLVEILMRYRPGENGRLQWPVRRVAELLGVSKGTAARALVELERNGWIAVTKSARFGGAHHPARYRLTMFDCPETGEPASHAYRFMGGERLSTDRKACREQGKNRRDGVLPTRLNSTMGGTPQSHGKDAGPVSGATSQRGSIIEKGKSARHLPAQSPSPEHGPEIRLDTAIDIIAAPLTVSPSLSKALKAMASGRR